MFRTPSPPRALSSVWARLALVIVLALFGAGCSAFLGGLHVKRVNSAQAKPNNVWVFFEVTQGEDEPVGGLDASDFEIYEDDKVVSKFESQQVIQNPDVAAVMYTLLLVDMSGSVAWSGQVTKLAESASKFVSSVGQHQKVGVVAFDGAEELHAIVPFTDQQDVAAEGIEKLRTWEPKDTSTNLHGAVIKGVQLLNKELEKDPRPLKFGTLVVFTDGTDRAARHTSEEMKTELAKEEYESYEIFAIGVGAELQESDLSDIGPDGHELVRDQAKVDAAFDKMAARIDAHRKRFYLLSYCTPARKGAHRVRVQVQDKKKEMSGSVEYEFNADGFGPPPSCDPNKKPSFDLKDVTRDDEAEKVKAEEEAQAKQASRAKVKVHGQASASAEGN